jgi:DNA-binding GntR family transcriptional regulator
VSADVQDDQVRGQATLRDGRLWPQSLQAIRELITSGAFLPGQPIRQAEVAARLHVSRVPVRDALNSLVAEGMVGHRPNAGYHVAKRTFSDLHQIYLMRRVLEAEIVRSIDGFSKQTIAAMERANRRMAAAAKAADVPTYSRLNREFHFIPFRQSPLTLVTDEVERLWNLSASYRSLYNYNAKVRTEIIEEHRAIVDAMGSGDQDRIVDVLDRHRFGAQARLVDALAGGSHPLMADVR